MRIGDALNGINECKFGARVDIFDIDIERCGDEEINRRVKDELICGIAQEIGKSDKLIINKIPHTHKNWDGSKTEFRTEIFVLTREELEKLITNVEINTRKQTNLL